MDSSVDDLLNIEELLSSQSLIQSSNAESKTQPSKKVVRSLATMWEEEERRSGAPFQIPQDIPRNLPAPSESELLAR